MSPKLKMFYITYLAWLNNGAPQDEPFDRSSGLCWNIELYTGEIFSPIQREMMAQFHAAGLRDVVPFNIIGASYGIEAMSKTCHENPARVAWVIKHATEDDAVGEFHPQQHTGEYRDIEEGADDEAAIP